MGSLTFVLVTSDTLMLSVKEGSGHVTGMLLELSSSVCFCAAGQNVTDGGWPSAKKIYPKWRFLGCEKRVKIPH